LMSLPVGLLCNERVESNCAVSRPAITTHRVA
jgi:hypothetical protein